MITKFIDSKTKKQVLDFYNKILNDDFTIDYLLESCEMMDEILLKVLPEEAGSYSIRLCGQNTLEEEILAMDSISEEEKEALILELIKKYGELSELLVQTDKKELLYITKQLIDKIESNLVEAKNHGYCTGLLQELNK